jgi:hypothetical protein
MASLYGTGLSLHGSRASLYSSRGNLHGFKVSLCTSMVNLRTFIVSLCTSMVSLRGSGVSLYGSVIPPQFQGELFWLLAGLHGSRVSRCSTRESLLCSRNNYYHQPYQIIN